MNIEYRFAVTTQDGYGHGRHIVAKISGHRKKVRVKVTSTHLSGWRSSLPITDWDNMPRDDKQARETHLVTLRRRVERSVRDLRDRRELLAKAEKEINNYPVVRLA